MSLAESKGDIQALSVSVVNNNVESKIKQERPSTDEMSVVFIQVDPFDTFDVGTTGVCHHFRFLVNINVCTNLVGRAWR